MRLNKKITAVMAAAMMAAAAFSVSAGTARYEAGSTESSAAVPEAVCRQV